LNVGLLLLRVSPAKGTLTALVVAPAVLGALRDLTPLCFLGVLGADFLRCIFALRLW
jgi:hypothetical protein